ncbi:hypothetical protein P5673_023200, partial [Acropora cervicornis]
LSYPYEEDICIDSFYLNSPVLSLLQNSERTRAKNKERDKEKCKRNRRLLNKLERRCSNFEFIKGGR